MTLEIFNKGRLAALTLAGVILVHSAGAAEIADAVKSIKGNGVMVSSSHGEKNLKNLFDKKPDNRWTTDASVVPGMWIELGFSNPLFVDSLDLDQGKSRNDFPKHYEVYVSDDGEAWGEPVKKGNGTPGATEIGDLRQTAKYIKILQTGARDGFWSIHDLRVNGVSLTEVKRIVAPKYKSFGDKMVQVRNESLTDSSPVYTDADVLQAIEELKENVPKLRSSVDVKNLGNLLDASKENRWTSGKQTPGMWFQLEFKKPLRIVDLTLDAGKSRGDYPRGYEVYFSDNGRKWGRPVASGEGSSAVTEIKGLNGTAHFVKIVQTGTTTGTHWSMHDLKVNGVSLSVGQFYAKPLWQDYPHQMAWLTQDAVVDREAARKDSLYDVNGDLAAFFEPDCAGTAYLKRIMGNVLSELGTEGAAFKKQFTEAATDKTDAGYRRCFKIYESACMARRKIRLQPLLAKTKQIVFSKKPVYGGIFFINETSGTQYISELDSIDLTPELDGAFAKVSTFVVSNGGMMRDPDLSFDAEKMLFAWRKSKENLNSRDWAPESGNYQIYEMDLRTKTIRPLTTDETYGANKEAIYLPNGDILFNSQRIVQHITCGWGDCSNFYLMNKDGKFQRRIGFDQTNTVDPMIGNDGSVIFLRRDYNDRGQSAAHALFQMNADGTTQTEYYGNQTGTPNSFQMPAPIPGSRKIAVVLGGYHDNQGGQLAIMDVKNGRQNDQGLIRIPQGDKAPTSPGYDDHYAKTGVQYADPYPLSETEFVVARSDAWGKAEEQYRIYFMNSKGERELLASDPDTSCMQPVLMMKRQKPPARPSLVDYKKKTGTFYVQNVYLGSAAEGIEPGSVKKLRVVEILYKHDTIGATEGGGPGGSTHSVMSPGHGLCSFDAKRILGEATVYEDGSAMFEAPARVPLYFQLLDDKNRVVQTMRSWATLMPGENFSCVGCHEEKNETPVSSGMKSIAYSKGVEALQPFYGPTRAFSYLKEVQPVFDKFCVRCHKPSRKGKALLLTSDPIEDTKLKRKFATSYVKLMAARPGPNPEEYRVGTGIKEWQRKGSILPDEPNKYVSYWTRLNTMGPKPPYWAGSIKSGLIAKLEEGHGKVSKEGLDKIKAWIDLNTMYVGEYNEPETCLWTAEETDLYKRRIAERQRNEEIERQDIQAYIGAGQP